MRCAQADQSTLPARTACRARPSSLFAQCDESLTAGKVLRQEGAFLRQASPEPPSDKHGCLRDIPVGRTTTIAFYSLEQIAELKFRADSSPPSAEPLKCPHIFVKFLSTCRVAQALPPAFRTPPIHHNCSAVPPHSVGCTSATDSENVHECPAKSSALYCRSPYG